MRIGIDLGGTKIEVIALSNEGKELFRKRVPTPRGSYEATLAAIKGLVDDAEQATGQTGTVGIGIPGTISPFSHKVKNANSVWLNGQPLDKDLCRLLGREVRIANDANCMTVSEATDGAGAGSAVVLALILGTGCGSGIVIHGKPHHGGNGIGENGDTILCLGWTMKKKPLRNKHHVIVVNTVVLNNLCQAQGCVMIMSVVRENV